MYSQNNESNLEIVDQFLLTPKKSNDGIGLSQMAKDIIVCAAESKNGIIFCQQLIGGYSCQAGDKNFDEISSPRDFARFKNAVEELESLKFISPTNYKRQMFEVSHEGYNIADELISLSQFSEE